MFFDKTFVTNAIFKKVWLAGHDIKTTRKVYLSKICKAIDKNRSRLSLKSTAMLINGAAKIYNDEVNKLLEDAKELEQELRRSSTHRNSESNYDASSSPKSTSSSTPATPEKVLSYTRTSNIEGSPPFCAGRRTSIFSIDTGINDDDFYSKTTIRDDSVGNKISSAENVQAGAVQRYRHIREKIYIKPKLKTIRENTSNSTSTTSSSKRKSSETDGNKMAPKRQKIA